MKKMTVSSVAQRIGDVDSNTLNLRFLSIGSPSLALSLNPPIQFSSCRVGTVRRTSKIIINGNLLLSLINWIGAFCHRCCRRRRSRHFQTTSFHTLRCGKFNTIFFSLRLRRFHCNRNENGEFEEKADRTNEKITI